MPPIPVSLKERIAGSASPVMGVIAQDLRLLIEAMVADQVTLRASYQALLVKIDAGVTAIGTNCAATLGTAVNTYYTSN